LCKCVEGICFELEKDPESLTEEDVASSESSSSDTQYDTDAGIMLEEKQLEQIIKTKKKNSSCSVSSVKKDSNNLWLVLIGALLSVVFFKPTCRTKN